MKLEAILNAFTRALVIVAALVLLSDYLEADVLTPGKYRKVPVNLVIASNTSLASNGLLTPRALEAYFDAAGLIVRDTKVYPKLIRTTVVPNPFAEECRGVPATCLTKVRGQWKNWLLKQKDKPLRRGMNLVIVPPFRNKMGEYWLAGLSQFRCSMKSPSDWDIPLAVVTAEETNQNGVDRFGHSVFAIAHELGHLLSATHDSSDNPPTTMHPGILYFIQALGMDAHFSARSIKQINRCVR